MTALIPKGEAQFSSCGLYRFRLTRELRTPARVYLDDSKIIHIIKANR